MKITSGVNGYFLYNNLSNRFSIIYPNNWEVKNLNISYAIVAFISPQNGDNFRPNVNVTLQDVSSNPSSLNDYVKRNIVQINQYFNNVENISSNKTIISSYDATRGKYTLKYNQIYMIINNRAYVLTYTTTTDLDNNEILSIFNKMADSSKLINLLF